MIAIAGTIGTGLFLGTGRSLANGGPASILICYAIIGFIVYVTLLLLGEMATQYPVAGECSRFILKREVGERCPSSASFPDFSVALLVSTSSDCFYANNYLFNWDITFLTRWASSKRGFWF
jgi:amino acid permease